jgi:hypothetical protein
MNTSNYFQNAIYYGFEEYPQDKEFSGRIISLGKKAFIELRQKRTLDLGINEFYTDCEDPLLNGCLCFVSCSEQEDGLWEQEPPNSIDKLLVNSFLCLYEGKRFPKLCLVTEGNLYEQLPGLLTKNMATQIPVIGNGDPIYADGEKEAIRVIRSLKSFSGRLGGCAASLVPSQTACWEALCSSTFAWVKNGVCLIHLIGSGGVFFRIHLFPFKTFKFIDPPH